MGVHVGKDRLCSVLAYVIDFMKHVVAQQHVQRGATVKVCHRNTTRSRRILFALCIEFHRTLPRTPGHNPTRKYCTTEFITPHIVISRGQLLLARHISKQLSSRHPRVPYDRALNFRCHQVLDHMVRFSRASRPGYEVHQQVCKVSRETVRALLRNLISETPLLARVADVVTCVTQLHNVWLDAWHPEERGKVPCSVLPTELEDNSGRLPLCDEDELPGVCGGRLVRGVPNNTERVDVGIHASPVRSILSTCWHQA
ncbi:hypothetical protein DFH29DRAFT_164625 [Suillus ampliporus]|nr:hypothetical protein DFH29DRAFT_164625 [Suillus ampliporus]